MKKATLFSIVVTTHSRPHLLERALLSILAQSFDDFEIVLATDEPSIGTKEMAIRYLRDGDIFLVLPNARGPSETRNAGIHHAKGRYILFLDDDDSFAENYLRDIVESQEFRTDAINYVNYDKLTEIRTGTSVQAISTEKMHIGATSPDSLLASNFIPNNCFVYSAQIAKTTHFDQHLNSHEDWDYLISLVMKYEFNFLDIYGPVVHVNEGESRNNDAKADGTIVLDFLSIYRKWPVKEQPVKQQRKETMQYLGFDLPLHLL
ncbi:glycosyltransferase family 2 protein [Oxalobacteraceae bacterium CAVE-383]|nr:glycosyltransferase family 2 protein [Oxalobacteraceae bacterium CAVE-383]